MILTIAGAIDCHRDAPIPAMTGNLIRLGDGHSVSIHTRQGLCWAAEFRCDCDELLDASNWFHVHAGALRHCHGHRAALANRAPTTPKLLEEIERLPPAGERPRHEPAAGRSACAVRASAAVLLHDFEESEWRDPWMRHAN